MEQVAKRGLRPKTDRHWPEAFTKLLTACWQSDARLRPEFSQIEDTLVGLLESASPANSASQLKMQESESWPAVRGGRVRTTLASASTWF